jgi:tRNA(adenine34) deaminase
MIQALSDEHFMKIAFQEAQMAAEEDEVPVGAVVVCKGKIIARAHNLTERLTDVTAHAEMQAITSASNYMGSKFLNDCSLYVTLEPCMMCAGAIAWARLGKLVFGAFDPKKGYTILNQDILHPKTEVKVGIMKEECSEILSKYFQSKRV